MSKPPRVFISYSHDNVKHKNWVLNLATNLRSNGIDVRLDQWHLKPGEYISKFMKNELEVADYTIAVCSKIYVQKAEEGKGGAGYESMILTALLMENLSNNKVIPIVRKQ